MGYSPWGHKESDRTEHAPKQAKNLKQSQVQSKCYYLLYCTIFLSDLSFALCVDLFGGFLPPCHAACGILVVGHCCHLVAESCLTLCDPMDCSPPGSSAPGIFPGKKTGVGCHFPLQGIFLTRSSHFSCIAGGFFVTEPPGKPHFLWKPAQNELACGSS